MRINGFEQIKGFYSWVFENQDKDIKPHHISLYMFLLNQNNRAGWVEWFKCPFDLAVGGSCITSKKTYYACLNDLSDWKLIRYKKGVNNFKSPVMSLVVLYDTSTVPQVEPQNTPLPIPLDTPIPPPILPPIPPPILPPIPPHIYKLITNNIKLITDNEEYITKNFLAFISKKMILKKEDSSNEHINIPFDTFWDLYDHKIGSKPKAVKKWNTLSDEVRQKIIDTLPEFKLKHPDKQFRPHPTTYLNNERWNDDLETIVLFDPYKMPR